MLLIATTVSIITQEKFIAADTRHAFTEQKEPHNL